MKKIHLHGPAVRNNGAYVDAGTSVTVGSDADHIAEDRAKAMVDRGVAMVEAVPAAASKPKPAPKPKRRSVAKKSPTMTAPVEKAPSGTLSDEPEAQATGEPA